MTADSVTGRGITSASGLSRGGDSTSMGVEKLIGTIRASQIDTGNLPLIPVERRLTVSNTDSAAQFSSIQDAIDSITDATISKKYIIELITTDTFVENVVLKDYVHITHVGFGQTRTAVLTSTSGDTLTCPSYNCSLKGFSVESTSASSSDVAIKILDSVEPVEYFTILDSMCVVGKGSAGGLWVSSSGGGEAVLYNTVIGAYGNVAAKIDNGVLAIFSGGTFYDVAQLFPSTTIKVTGGFCVVLNFSFANDAAGSGYVLDMDASTCVILQSFAFSSSNILRLANGSTGIMLQFSCLNPPAAAPVTIDATSVLIYGSGFCPDGFGTAVGFGGTGWVVDPAAVFLPAYDLKFSSGTTSGPDQRPTAVGITPAAGTTFFANDSAMGGGAGSGVLLYYIPGTGWIDFTGAVHA